MVYNFPNKLDKNTVTVASLSTILRWIGDWFQKADKNNDGRMNFKEVRDLLRMMNVDMNEHHAHRLFTVSLLIKTQGVGLQ